MDLDAAIISVFYNFAYSTEDLVLQPRLTRAFVNVVLTRHGAPLAYDLIIRRLLELEGEGRLPEIVVTRPPRS